MIRIGARLLPLLLALTAAGGLVRAEPVRVQGLQGNLSLRLEIEHHLDRGLAWLRARQDGETGSWGKGGSVEMTGFALTVLMGNRAGSREEAGPAAGRGYAFLLKRLSFAGEEGESPVPAGAWVRALPALFFVADRPEIQALIRKGTGIARRASLPEWEEEYRRREVLHSAMALGLAQGGVPPAREISWADPARDPRISYLKRVARSWVEQPAGEAEDVSWRVWARGKFAEHLQSTDVRLHEAMAKALLAGRVDRVLDDRGREVDWREKLAVRLFDLQKRDGSWAAEIPAAEGGEEMLETTCRALLALQTMVNSL